MPGLAVPSRRTFQPETRESGTLRRVQVRHLGGVQRRDDGVCGAVLSDGAVVQVRGAAGCVEKKFGPLAPAFKGRPGALTTRNLTVAPLHIVLVTLATSSHAPLEDRGLTTAL